MILEHFTLKNSLHKDIVVALRFNTPSYPGRIKMTSFIKEIMLEICHVLLV